MESATSLNYLKALSQSQEPTITWTIPCLRNNPPTEEDILVARAIGAFSDSPATFEWFKVRGYTLFVRDVVCSEKTFRPRKPSEGSCQADYPFPHHNVWRPNVDVDDRVWPSFVRGHASIFTFTQLILTMSQGKSWFAEDRQGRHVVINLVPEGSDELRVYELLKEQSYKTLQDVCLLPVLDILTLGKFRFVVLPR